MAEKKRTLKKQEQAVPLDAGGIDSLSTLSVMALTEVAVDRKDIIRLRLAIEDVLGLWQGGLEAGAICTFQCGTRLGRPYIRISVPGRKIDPGEAEGEDAAGGTLYSRLMAQAGLSLIYDYKDGRNILSLYPPKPRRMGSLMQLLIAIAAAAACGGVCLLLPDGVQSAASAVIDPLFSAMMGLLQTLAGPMIFLSICWGIVSMGDVGVLGKIGKTIVLRFLAAIYIITILTAVCVVWFFHGAGGAGAGDSSAIAQIYSMLLSIVPTNIVTPFQEGNTLQIIFMAVCVGLTLLLLGEKVPAVFTFVGQVNTAVQFMMETLSKYMPLFIFVSLTSLILSNALSGLEGVVKGVVLSSVACVIWPALYVLVAAVRLRVSPALLFKKLLPTYLIALTTASSSAALSTNLETCERRLGISERITRFAVPLGQVVFKTGGSVGFFIISLGLAEYYGLAMPLSWVVTAVLVSALVAIATPPVPGGFMTSCTVLLSQLGIPTEAVALVVAANVILDFFMTSCGISSLQSELLLAANRLGMLDEGLLRKE